MAQWLEPDRQPWWKSAWESGGSATLKATLMGRRLP